MAISFKGAHFPTEVILMGVRWYLAYPLSTRHVEELMEERGIDVDHATINRWVIKYSPQLEAQFHRRKRSVWTSWRMDKTYIKVKGEWKYLYRAVDKFGKTIDFRGCFKGVDLPSESPPKLIAVDEEPNDQIVHALCFGETDCPTHQPLDPSP